MNEKYICYTPLSKLQG